MEREEGAEIGGLKQPPRPDEVTAPLLEEIRRQAIRDLQVQVDKYFMDLANQVQSLRRQNQELSQRLIRLECISDAVFRLEQEQRTIQSRRAINHNPPDTLGGVSTYNSQPESTDRY